MSRDLEAFRVMLPVCAGALIIGTGGKTGDPAKLAAYAGKLADALAAEYTKREDALRAEEDASRKAAEEAMVRKDFGQ